MKTPMLLLEIDLLKIEALTGCPLFLKVCPVMSLRLIMSLIWEESGSLCFRVSKLGLWAELTLRSDFTVETSKALSFWYFS